jgi:DNA mismatch repair protein MutS
MKTAVFNGLSTTINLRDDLNLGYSHFYSEVRRVKEAATNIREQQRMVVIFDELFRGTNVRDAFEGSLWIINALLEIPDSLFFISTHLIEVADKITNPGSVLFRYLDITMEEDQPVYSYLVKEGISEERLGLLILKREKILELLKPE